ncbi:unnamed protein product [Caenorhabditis auriculariae]|uniref:G domain-containing protein n=1 Tax=Caenorhabditis auriculariae TaxID=2777116 RepID=A0A8S1HV83_9PELO|nr:unnamed protein product [Caenorhabditis auriculariae]
MIGNFHRNGLFRLFSTKADIQKTLKSLKNSPNRSAQISELYKKFDDFERDLMNEEQRSTEFAATSMIGENFLKNEKDYDKVVKRREREAAGLKKEEPKRSQTFPLLPTAQQVFVKPNELVDGQNVEQIDRGFYVEAGTVVDEYVAGCSMDLDPGDLIVSSRQYFGSEDAVEHISFQQPGQRLHEEESVELEESAMQVETTGTVDESRPSSDQTCGGCGAHFHCKDPSLPGFLPVEVFEKVERSTKNKEDQSMCKRCHLLQKHNFLLNVNVCNVDYSKMMSELKKSNEMLVLLIVDVTDLPGSIHPNLAEIIGAGKPMIVIGNKVDLLPPDARTGYMSRFKQTVERTVEKMGLLEKFNILHTGLISAKTGYGVEELITQVFLKYTNVRLGMRGDIYLVGCTNSGKSTLFNAFLQSDLCKVRAIDLVDRATASIWPGTTMNLLKFPVMKPSPYRLEMRRRRLLQQRAWMKKEVNSRKLLLQETGDPQYAIPIATIQNSFKEDEDELQPMALNSLKNHEEKEKKKSWSLDDAIFSKGKWCFDTPGTVNDQQVLNLFTLDELVNVTPRRLLTPRTAILKAGESLVIGGVARIDICEADDNLLLTTFVSDSLPLNVLPTEEVDRFLAQYAGTPALVVPCGDQERMKSWPALKSREFDLFGRKDSGCCDIVLSSLGWVMVSSERALKLAAYTPDGRGLTARLQPVLPYSANLRGKRIPGTNFYKVQPIEFPLTKWEKNPAKQRRWKNT